MLQASRLSLLCKGILDIHRGGTRWASPPALRQRGTTSYCCAAEAGACSAAASRLHRKLAYCSPSPAGPSLQLQVAMACRLPNSSQESCTEQATSLEHTRLRPCHCVGAGWPLFVAVRSTVPFTQALWAASHALMACHQASSHASAIAAPAAYAVSGASGLAAPVFAVYACLSLSCTRRWIGRRCHSSNSCLLPVLSLSSTTSLRGQARIYCQLLGTVAPLGVACRLQCIRRSFVAGDLLLRARFPRSSSRARSYVLAAITLRCTRQSTRPHQYACIQSFCSS